MYKVWHVDKYKITFKYFINLTKEILQHIVVSSGISRPGIIDARARYRAAARRLRNTALVILGLLLIHKGLCGFQITHNDTPQSVGLLWMSDQLVAETSTRQNTTITTDRHPCNGGIRTHDLCRRAAVDLRLKPRGHWDRHVRYITDKNFRRGFYNTLYPQVTRYTYPFKFNISRKIPG